MSMLLKMNSTKYFIHRIGKILGLQNGITDGHRSDRLAGLWRFYNLVVRPTSFAGYTNRADYLKLNQTFDALTVKRSLIQY